MLYSVAIRTGDDYLPYHHILVENQSLFNCFVSNWASVWRFSDAFGLQRSLIARAAIYQGV